jgi:hypothetical protein
MVLNLLFDLASWHAFAKLRLHTDDTLSLFDSATVILGQTVREFSKTTCKHYHTTELPQEYSTRGRREAALSAKQVESSKGKERSSGKKVKKLNLHTYKYHALGDYPNTIRRMGTTDNYTTQPVSAQLNF